MTDFLISAADLVFTGDTLLERASILVEGQIIRSLNPPAGLPAPRTVNGHGQLVLPAAINAADPRAYPHGAVPLEPARLRRVSDPAGHLVQVRLTTEECRFRFGRRPVDVLADFGWLVGGVSVCGLTDLSPEEVLRVSQAGVALVHCPTQELLTGHALPALRQWIDAGITVGLGGDPLTEARQTFLMHQKRGQEIAAAEALSLATLGSARATGQPGGVIREGAPANLWMAPSPGSLERFLLEPPPAGWRVVTPLSPRAPQPA